jgi:outer membrane protein assembly factor BamA
MVAYADLVLPDTTYLERHDCISLLDRPISEPDAMCDAIRWPVIEPGRDVRGFQSVLLDLGARLGLPGMVGEDGSPKYRDYADYIVNHERRAGVGPRDITGGASDALGGTELYRGTVELTFPLGLPTELGVRGSAFTDFGTLREVDASPRPGEVFRDTGTIRASVGVGLSWRSPLGPIRLDFAKAVKKEDFDRDEFFRFSLGTRF